MKVLSSTSFRIASALLILVVALTLSSSPALASTIKGECEAQGGTWKGPDSSNGSCTYGEASDFAEKYCGSSYAVYTEDFSAGVFTGADCNYTRGFGGRGDTSDNKAATGPITLNVSGGKNGKVTFPAGLCDPQCSITPTLPTPAKNALPSGVLAKLYVRVPSSAASYLVCFKNPSGQALSAYRLVGDAWVRVLSSSSNPGCFYANGSGAFYLDN